MSTPAKKAVTKKAAPKLPEYEVTSDRCTLGARGDKVRRGEVPRSLIIAGHLRPVPPAAKKDDD